MVIICYRSIRRVVDAEDVEALEQTESAHFSGFLHEPPHEAVEPHQGSERAWCTKCKPFHRHVVKDGGRDGACDDGGYKE